MPDTPTHRTITGSCHCANIRFTFDVPAALSPIPVRACGCTFCVKHRGIWTSHSQGRFALQIDNPALVNLYRFATNSADFHICTNCGVAPIVTCMIGSTRYAVLNANTFDNVDRSELVEAPMNFEAETIATRLARRARNWTPEATTVSTA